MSVGQFGWMSEILVDILILLIGPGDVLLLLGFVLFFGSCGWFLPYRLAILVSFVFFVLCLSLLLYMVLRLLVSLTGVWLSFGLLLFVLVGIIR